MSKRKDYQRTHIIKMDFSKTKLLSSENSAVIFSKTPGIGTKIRQITQ